MPASLLAKIEAFQEIIAEGQDRIIALRRQAAGVQQRIEEEQKVVDAARTRLAALCVNDPAQIGPSVRGLVERFGGKIPISTLLDLVAIGNDINRNDLPSILYATISGMPDITIQGEDVKLLTGRRTIAGPRKQGPP